MIKQLIKKIPLIKKITLEKYYKKVITESMDYPASIWIEPTNNCNLECTICPRKKSTNDLGFMDFQLYKKIIDQLPSTTRITLHKDGEPLLHSNIIEMISYAKKAGIKEVRFSSNVMFLKDTIAKKLINAGLDSITITINGVNAKQHEKVNIKSCYKTMQKHISQLSQIKNSLNSSLPKVQIQMVDMNYSVAEKKLFLKQWKPIADEVKIKPLLSWSGKIGKHSINTSRLPCLSLWTSLAISWNGDASVCCTYIDEFGKKDGIVGNAGQSTIKEIWQGEKHQKIRLSHLTNNYRDVPTCAKCKDWYYSLNSIESLWNDEHLLAQEYKRAYSFLDDTNFLSKSKQIIVVLPTYNEKENIQNLVEELLVKNAYIDILIVDDNSPDGTGIIATDLSNRNERVNVLHRKTKDGIGGALIKGFQYAIKNNYKYCVTMDADYSHPPKYLPALLKKAPFNDIVIGSRYINGGKITGWGIARRFTSRLTNFFNRKVLGLHPNDCTGNFRSYRIDRLKTIDLSKIQSKGYAFLEEILLVLQAQGSVIDEIPIEFINREKGNSKVSLKEITTSVSNLLSLWMRKWEKNI